MKEIDRRSFLKRGAAVGGALVAAPYFVPSTAFGANERIAMGIIGSGGRGRGVMGDLMRGGAVFSGVCDVYEPNLVEGVKVAASDGGRRG